MRAAITPATVVPPPLEFAGGEVGIYDGRQEERDRMRAENDYLVNLKAELEIWKTKNAEEVAKARQEELAAANKRAADLVWQAITDKQRGGEIRLKIPFKVIKSSPERIDGAITDANQARNVIDIEIAMGRPLNPVPVPGEQIAIVGTLKDYRAQPFVFVMNGGELAPESLPVAGGACADPRRSGPSFQGWRGCSARPSARGRSTLPAAGTTGPCARGDGCIRWARRGLRETSARIERNGRNRYRARAAFVRRQSRD